ncbi:MAG: GDSL-type esterase/lipase family protein [Raineya sp.]|nr:GDSL-type esterase/lipase family protein [Raineya sp.]MDW8297051.1 GDSL-type esterase/lipase family protein [Raineya sp.]
MNTLLLLAIVLLLLIVVGGVIYAYLYGFLFKTAPNNPKNFLAKPQNSEKKRIVFAGDSLTCGNMSADYTAMVAEKLKNAYEYINAGVNADLAYNLLQRLDEIIACKPDFVTILIGTNDANATIFKQNQAVYQKLKKLPQPATIFWYEENLCKIVERLQNETSAQIALISMPVIGENLKHKVHSHIKEYVEVVKKVAQKYQVAYLPLYEKHVEFLEKQSPIRKEYHPNHKLIELAMFQKYILQRTWDEIAKTHGFHTVTDFIHLNSIGAKMIAELVCEWIEKHSY